MTRIPSLVALLAALLAGGLAQSVPAATGNDLGFGYSWRDSADGATLQSVVPDPFTTANPADNSAPVGPVAMGFTFPFYGATYTNVWVSDNGWISFQNPAGNPHPTPSGIPTAPGPVAMVAPFWSDLNASNSLRHLMYWGPVPSIGGWMVTWGAGDNLFAQDVSVDCILFPDGRIKFQYRSAANISIATIGVEAAPPVIDGIQIVAGGVLAHPDVAITPNYVIEILPPPILQPHCGAIGVAACGAINDSLPGPLPDTVDFWSCSATAYTATERIYRLDLASPTVLDVTLTGTPGMRLFLLSACSERACIAGPLTTLRLPLGIGTYYLVVDAFSAADHGAYSLNVTCAPLGTPIACGDTVSGTTIGGSTLFNSYPTCTAARSLAGAEAIYSISFATPTNLRISLTAGLPIDIFVVEVGTGIVTGSSCTNWGDTQAVAWDVQSGDYLIILDSAAGSEGAYTMSLTCGIAISCATLEDTIDIGVSRVATISGDTTGAPNRVDIYACDELSTLPGGEHIYRIDMPLDGHLGVYPITGNATYYFLSSCNEGACVGGNTCAQFLTAGTYYLAVDSAGLGGPYEALIVFEEPFNRWSVCEQPVGATTLATTSSPFWNFSDEGFCWDFPGPPTNINYPDGCTFAMYATVRCGTAMHLPFWDCESGNIRIFDVFRGEYLDLTAISDTGFFQQGTEIIWQTDDCVAGSDPLFNETVVDVFFDRPEGLCGIFRIEFPYRHSGFVWELYANCTGARSPGFDIHDSLCTALANFFPLPSVSLISASGDYACPDVTVTYTVENTGCIEANNYPVVLSDGPTVVYTDIIPRIDAGETLTRVFTATFPVTPTTFVILQTDPSNVITECNDVPGQSCGAGTVVDTIDLPGCSGSCQVVAQGRATPASTCVGSPITIDASTSTSSLCPGGVLEYQLSSPLGTIPWQTSPVFPGLLPTMQTDFFLEVRCQGQPGCRGTRNITVPVERPPDFPAASVRAFDEASCTLGIQLTWDPATFFGTTGSGSYNIYKSTVSCADAIARGPHLVGQTTLSLWDPATVVDGTYYYVIEAEDGQPNTRCVPQGPRNSGAVTRVEANGGICVGITDRNQVAPDLLPRIGGTLRAGGDYGNGITRYDEGFVEFTWGTDRPLDVPGGEHFHFYRSSTPDGGWSRRTTDAPILQTGAFTDRNADHPDDATYVYYYLAFVSDSCDNENTAYDDR